MALPNTCRWGDGGCRGYAIQSVLQFTWNDLPKFLFTVTGNQPQQSIRRGRSLLGREEDVHESGLALFKRGTLRRKTSQVASTSTVPVDIPKSHRSCLGDIGPGPKDGWYLYCYLLTCYIPGFLLRSCGIRTPEQQRAWREKIGLIGVILLLMGGVGFLTFGFTDAVCGKPANRYHAGTIQNSSVIIHGYDYDFSNFEHPAVGPFPTKANPLFEGNWNAAGNDISFLFQNVNQNCRNYITKAANSSITGNNGDLNWYFPCNIYSQQGNSGINITGYEAGTNCHFSASAKSQFGALSPQGQVYYTWEDVHNPNRNLAVFESYVL